MSVVNLTASHEKQGKVSSILFNGGIDTDDKMKSMFDFLNQNIEQDLDTHLSNIQYNLQSREPFSGVNREENMNSIAAAGCCLWSLLGDAQTMSDRTRLALKAIKLEQLKERDLQYKNRLKITTKIPREWAFVRKIS